LNPRVIKLPCFDTSSLSSSALPSAPSPSAPSESPHPTPKKKPRKRITNIVVQEEEPEQSAAPESKNKKKVKTTKVSKTSRSQRDAAERQRRMAQALAQGTELKIQQRSRGLGQVINDGLKGLCETVTLSKGDTQHLLNTYMASNLQPAVEAFVAAGLASEFRETLTDDPAALCGHVLHAMQVDILDTLTQLSKLSTDLVRICTHATEHYISNIMTEHPDINDYEMRKEKLQPILRGQSFFRTLAVALYQPSRLKKTRVNDESALAREIAVKFEEDYAHIAQPVLERIRAFLDGTIHLSVIEEIARHASDRIRTQAHHYVNTLKTRVRLLAYFQFTKCWPLVGIANHYICFNLPNL
ncbi:hypothetical protein BGW41_006851, partial [Actinomortierella wolfii]